MGLIILFLLCVVFIEVKCSYSNSWLLKGDLSAEEVKLLCKQLDFRFVHQLETGHFVFEKENMPKTSKRKDVHYTKLLKRNPKVHFVEQEEWLSLPTRQTSFPVSDPMWPRMWYINNGTYPNMGILDMWLANYTGQGVTIGIVDDGVEYTHTDLTNKFDRTTSYDFYDFDNDPSPSHPSYDHGTKCAGVALSAKNNVCVIGAGYNSKLSGIIPNSSLPIRVNALRLLGPDGARKSGQIGALTMKGVDIFSNSWGGTDGKFEGPSTEVADALRSGTSGNLALRGGKGAIYVFPAGNGGSSDDCNTDGYVNSIYTIGIFGVDRDSEPPGYAEPCSAALASAFTGKGGLMDNICTTSVNDGCTDDFTGTSAAAPLAAGTLALLLQANDNLSWRDVQELIVRTSRLDALKYTEARLNGVGRNVSHWFGYGLLDIAALIKVGKSWRSLGKQNLCKTATQVMNRTVVSTSNIVQSSITTDGCNATANCVNRLEHVQVRVKFFYSNRGSVELKLTSPMGTISTLLSRRSLDTDTNSQQEWVYTSIHHWEENPFGTWTLALSVAGTDSGKLDDWDLRMFGTGEGCTVEESTTDSNKQLMCYSCEDMSDLALCDTVQKCREGEVCVVERTYAKYRSGCANSSICTTYPSSRHCAECCNNDYCNGRGCGDEGLVARNERGPLCYDCNHVRTIQQCTSIRPCNQHETCSIEEFEWLNLTHLKLGCVDAPCSAIGNGVLRSLPRCKSCCDQDFCNTNCTHHQSIGIIG